MRYLYIGCTGGDFDTDEELTIAEMYCETCGDGSEFVGCYETDKERDKLLDEFFNRYN